MIKIMKKIKMKKSIRINQKIYIKETAGKKD